MINLTPRDRLQYALKVQRLHEVLVLKDDIHLQYKYKNINRATTQAASFQDKIIDAVIENTVTGTDNLIGNSSIKNNVRKIIDTNLKNDAKRISYGVPEKVTKAAVSNISNRYQTILNNRINKEIPTLQDKIEQHIKENNLSNLSEAELTNKLKAEYGEHAQKRIQNIVRDSFHTNECNLSWVKAVYDGYSYKIWNNGRTKRTRVWHKAKFIQSVPIDETFDIFGSYPARMMYPGDLNGGAENVANCKCWLSYTNNKPSDLRGTGKKTTTKKSTKSTKSNKSKNNKGLINKVKNTVKNPVTHIKSKIKNISNKVTSKIKPQKRNSKIDFSKFELNNLPATFSKDTNKAVTIGNKTIYGVGESEIDQYLFGEKYGIKKEDLTKEEYNFIKLFSGDGYGILNKYLRTITNVNDLNRGNIIKRIYSIKWIKMRFKHFKYYMSFDDALKISESVFKKGKILEEDLVVVRRQKSSMTKYTNGNIYHSDSFLATSISENVKPHVYGNYINYIVVPKGTKILYIEGITLTDNEYEILFNINTELRLVGEKSEFVTFWEMI